MKAPCNGCDRRLVGCHSVCPEYQKWKTEWQKMKDSRPKKPEFSRSMKKMLRRRMLGR